MNGISSGWPKKTKLSWFKRGGSLPPLCNLPPGAVIKANFNCLICFWSPVEEVILKRRLDGASGHTCQLWSLEEKGKYLDLIKKCNDAIISGRATMAPIDKIDFTPWLGPIAGPVISSVPQVQNAGAGAKQWLQSLPSVQEFINRPANEITDGRFGH